MAWLADKEFWVALIGYASIASVAVFGLFGAYAKTRGKPGTAAEARSTGRLELVSILGIIFSAVFAMTSAILKSWIDDEKAAQQAASTALDDAAQRLRFYTQLATLYRLNLGMSQANADSRATLRKQDRLLSSAQRSMLMTAGLTAQERANTGRVLRTMWDDSNRIRASSLSLVVTYRCGPLTASDPDTDFPILLPTASAVVNVAPTPTMARLGIARNAFGTYPALQGGDVVDLTSIDQVARVSRERSVDGDRVVQTSRFTDFRTRDLRGMEAPERWRDVVIDVVLRDHQPGIVSNASRLMGKTPEQDEAVARYFTFPGISEDSVDEVLLSRLDCQADMELSVNGRVVADSQGHIVQVWEGDDQRGLVVVRFLIAPARRDAFPRFAGR